MKINLPIKKYILSQNLALTISIVIILFWNFFANRYWTYNDVPIGNMPFEKPSSGILDSFDKEVD
jgi:putative flippase GtrA